jgi:hypothetical protein
LGITNKAGKALCVYRADLPAGIHSAVVETDVGKRIVMLDSGLDAVGRDAALFQCLIGLDDHGKAAFAPPPPMRVTAT